MTLDDVIDDILRREGGYVDKAEDRGGPTKHGITINALSEWRGHQCTREDVMALTESEARDIYRNVYAIRPNLVVINNPELLGLAVDCAVNHGPKKAIRMLQSAAHVTVDGVLGVETAKAVNTIPPKQMFARLIAERVRYYGEIISKDPELAKARQAGFKLQAVFAAGWANRQAEFIEAIK